MNDLEEFRDFKRVEKFSLRQYLTFLTFPYLFLSSFLFGLGGFCLLACVFAVLYGNFVEYSIHRWVLHDFRKWNRDLYKLHSGNHHRFFTFHEMGISQEKDYHEVVTPWSNVLWVSLLGAIPASILGLILGFQFFTSFLSSVLLYQILYEWVHAQCHFPKNHWVYSIPLWNKVLFHHRIHHDLKQMRHCNFNIVFPLFDALLGTLKVKDLKES